MTSSGSSDWADRLREELRRHEEMRSGGRGTGPDPGNPDRPIPGQSAPTDPEAGSSNSGWGTHTRTTTEDVSLGQIALEWGLIDASCLRDCQQDREDARREGKDLPFEAILLGRGVLKSDDLDKLRLEKIRRSKGTW